MSNTNTSCRTIKMPVIAGGISGRVLDRSKDLGMFTGDSVWSDGTNIYKDSIEVLKGGKWEKKIWNGLTDFDGEYIWTDGTNIYYSYSASDGTKQYVLNKETDTWEEKTWGGSNDFSAKGVWTDGTNIYSSATYGGQYVLNKETDTWEEKTWNIGKFYGGDVWTDGTNIYLNKGHILNKDSGTWEKTTFNSSVTIEGAYIWTDGVNIYHSYTRHDVLNGDTWEQTMADIPFGDHYGTMFWTDGKNIYSSNGDTVLFLPTTAKLYVKQSSWAEVGSIS